MSERSHLEIRDLPSSVTKTLDMLALVRGCPKWRLVREALIEYVTNHKGDLIKFSTELSQDEEEKSAPQKGETKKKNSKRPENSNISQRTSGLTT